MRDEDMRKSITVTLGFIVQRRTDDPDDPNRCHRSPDKPLEVLDSDGDRYCFAADEADAEQHVRDFVEGAMGVASFVASLD